MVSKLIVAGTLFFGAVFAEPELKTEDFESAICTKSYQEHKELSKDLNLGDLIKTHGCCKKHLNLCAVHIGKEKYLTCSSGKMDELNQATTFKGEKFTIHANDIKVSDVTRIECKAAEHTYDHKFEKAIRVMTDMKTKLEDLGEVKEDTSTFCMAVTEEEAKKDGDKKEDGEKKEAKKIFKVQYFTVKEKNHKTTDKVEKVTIFEKKYEALFCGTKADVVKEAKAFETAGEASGCCSCAWYVWVIVAVIIVGAGAGAYVIFKADEDEDEFANEYSA